MCLQNNLQCINMHVKPKENTPGVPTEYSLGGTNVSHLNFFHTPSCIFLILYSK